MAARVRAAVRGCLPPSRDWARGCLGSIDLIDINAAGEVLELLPNTLRQHRR
jgi:hypothetical protein